MPLDLYKAAAPFLRLLDAETAHRAAIGFLQTGLAVRLYRPAAPDPDSLRLRLWGRDFANPIGLAAGFDKNAAAAGPLLHLGFGFVEIGGVTPRPQPGNPRPRVFRLTEDGAVINRMGFNNDGLAAVAARLDRLTDRPAPVGVNLGKNKDSEDAVADYAIGARRFATCADFLVVNVSSPNTPGLRMLQNIEPLRAILVAVRQARDEALAGRAAVPVPPLLLKIAPDLATDDVSAIVDLAQQQALDGLVVSNTTISRPDGLRSAHRGESGGLSGRPLFTMSTAVLRHAARASAGQLPLIGVGGVSSGADAYAKIRAGASLVQLYSALAFQGPGLIPRIKRELADLLARDGFASVAAAVGADR
jgi:dihydroorotate dehydrogenase